MMSETNDNQSNNSKKPLLDQVREAIQNKEQIKEQVVQNLQFAGKIAEAQAKEFVKQAKQSKFFNEQVVPFAGSDLADKALDVLNTKLKLKDTQIMKQIEKVRKDILDTQVAKAKDAKVADADSAAAADDSSESSSN